MASLLLWNPCGWDILIRLPRIFVSRFRHVVLLWIIYTHQSSNNHNHSQFPFLAVQGLSSPHERNYPLGMPPMPPPRGGPFLTPSSNDDSPSHHRHQEQQQGHHYSPQHDTKTAVISSKCACGRLRMDIPIRYGPNIQHRLIDCHCSACRRYHVSGLVRYLHVPASDLIGVGDTAMRFRDSCNSLGSVDRTYCNVCKSKLLTTRVNQNDDGETGVYVNMGPIDDATLPDDLAEAWKQSPVTQWNANMAASWVNAQPGYQQPLPSSRTSGGCTCGACQYDYQLKAPMEIQHCYCYLCRQLSGGLFMSWIPVKTVRQKFHWSVNSDVEHDESKVLSPARRGHDTIAKGPLSHRYTSLGERHSCSACGGILSILYDYEDRTDEHATIWLAAGGFDSIRFPFRIEPYLDRAVHICCRYRPKWYDLPHDGFEQIQDAA